MDIIRCEKGDGAVYHAPDCINGVCTKCQETSTTLKKYYESIPDSQTLTWCRWENEETGATGTRKVLETKSGTKDDLIQEFTVDIFSPAQGTTFPKHLFTARWQLQQFNLLKDNVPDDSVVQVMDFAKNRDIVYDTEIKSAFFSSQQITLHPFVNYYNSQTGTVHHSVIIISDDKTHGYHAVDHFHRSVQSHLKECGVNIGKAYVWSDGCSSQYKSRRPFADLSLNENAINRNYFGSEHGKSECDAEIGIINRAVDRAISGQSVVINDARDMFEYCQQTQSMDDFLTKRTFLYVSSEKIIRDRPLTTVKTVPQTRKIHQIKNNPSEPYSLQIRSLSCFCAHCAADDVDLCINKSHISPFVEKTLVLTNTLPMSTNMMMTLNSTGIEKDVLLQDESEMSPLSLNDMSIDLSDVSVDLHDDMTPHQPNSSGISSIVSSTAEITDYIDSPILDRAAFFSNRLDQLQSSEDFATLQAHALLIKEEMQRYPISLTNNLNINDHELVVDELSVKVMPQDVSTTLKNCLPIKIYGDGNCLPRCGSLLAFGEETFHEEIRPRICVEMCTAELYIQNDYLNRNITLPLKEAMNFYITYTMFSEHYVGGDVITPAVAQRIYRQEAFQISKRGTCMGIWQIFALASVLKCHIRSIYPATGPGVPRLVLNSLIGPRHDDNPGKECNILWTSSNPSLTNPRQNKWYTNHFVTVVPKYPGWIYHKIRLWLDLASRMLWRLHKSVPYGTLCLSKGE